MTRKAFKVEEVVPGSHLLYTYEELTPKGERLVVELLRFENSGGANSIPARWHKNGYTSTVLCDWWSVQTYAYDTDGNCYMRYNPTVKCEGTRAVVDFSWKLSATEENREKILSEIERRAFGED